MTVNSDPVGPDQLPIFGILVMPFVCTVLSYVSSAISRTICFSECNRCSSQNDCCLYCYCSGGVVWSSERAASCFLLLGCAEALPFSEVRGSTPGEFLQFLFLSRACNLSVLMMHSKAHGFSLWWSRLAYLPWKTYLWHVMECRGAPEGTPT